MEHSLVMMLICNIWWAAFKAKTTIKSLMHNIKNFCLRVQIKVSCKTFNKPIILKDKILIIMIWCLSTEKITFLIHRNFSQIAHRKVTCKITFLMLKNTNQIAHWLKSIIYLAPLKLTHNHNYKVPADLDQTTTSTTPPNSIFLTNNKQFCHQNTTKEPPLKTKIFISMT